MRIMILVVSSLLVSAVATAAEPRVAPQEGSVDDLVVSAACSGQTVVPLSAFASLKCKELRKRGTLAQSDYRALLSEARQELATEHLAKK